MMEPTERFVANDEGCVSDLLTGLQWEQKRESGLRSWEHTYSWYNPGQSHRELDYRGTPDAGECSEIDCDTNAYMLAVNAAALCGFSDWRIPTKDELYSISDLSRGRVPPTAYMSFFPHTQPAEYWTAHDYSFQHESAWAWSFEYGHDRVDWKRTPKFLRLVRGSADELVNVKE